MALFSKRDPAEDLIALLDVERHALRDGAYDVLSGLIQKKARLTDLVAGTPTSESTIRRLRAAAERNAATLKGAMEGMQRARARLAARDESQSPLRTYSSSGLQTDLQPGKSAVERKA